jgi:thioesterase domain-containing protein/acyl carrier protein
MVDIVMEPGTVKEIDIKDYLRKQLPDYMIPNRFILMDKLPLNPNGKIDRNRLPNPDFQLEGNKYPDTRVNGIEARIFKIWEKIIGSRRIEDNPDFFLMGGNSIDMLKVASEIHREFGTEIPIIELFNNSRLKSLAEIIIKRQDNLHLGIEDNFVLFNEKKSGMVFGFPPGAGFGICYMGLSKKLENYSLCCFNFIEKKDRLQRYVDHIGKLQPQGPYVFFGWSSGGRLCFDAAKEMEKHGREVSDIIMLDTKPGQKKVDNLTDKCYKKEKEDFMNNLNSVLKEMKLELYKDRVNRVADSYWQYDSHFSQTGKVKANIHVIQSKWTKIQNFDWSPYTSNHFFTYKGAGTHVKMMSGAHLDKNSRILKDIFENIKVNTQTQQPVG